jgi:TetR/AcrR family transcriptional repressor of uid operon
MAIIMDRVVHSSTRAGTPGTEHLLGSPSPPSSAQPTALLPHAGARRSRAAAGAPAIARLVATEPAATPTRQRILEAALSLFNERGTAAVTTNHIAAAAGVSPGNLYYWFGNKQEIVRPLVDDWLAALERQSQEVVDGPADVHSLWEDLGRTAELDWRYRFIGREAMSLVHRDEQLSRSYRESYRRRLSARVGYARRLVSAGVLREPVPPRTLEDLVVAVWLIVENWAAHQMLIKDDRKLTCAMSGIRPLLVVLGPHLTQQGRRAFEVL